MNAEPKWSDKAQNLGALIDRRIALRFLLCEAEIHAFRSVPRSS